MAPVTGKLSDVLHEIEPEVYDDLRRLASSRLRGSSLRSRCQTTDLVHEAVVRMRSASERCETVPALYVLAARVMRSIIVDMARRRSTELKHLEPLGSLGPSRSDSRSDRHEDLLRLDAAIMTLTEVHPRAAEVVALRFFGGLTPPQIAEGLGVTDRTVRREWNFARAWIHERLEAQSK